ncbi:MAG: hypothetical protein LQ352_002808 [Teloschistes flavicans]|nr:MAG: hypothetical protein LQ352_002808 [Teloschistes flavicans]
MATRRLSPTASLLKNSRLFSLPPPLPRPSHDYSKTSDFDSDTATLPYPTRAAIETTQPSLSRGDWGLKRPLPQKSTVNTSTPAIRIDQIDSIDHIAEFESAADHTLTLQKWQEIGLPLSMPVKQKGAYVGRERLNTRTTTATSVFEPAYDNTEKSAHDSHAMRWKFKGPWLAGKTAGDFNQYVEKHVRQRKLDFRNFVRDRMVHTRTLRQTRIAQENGDVMDIQVNVTEQDVDLYLKQLRQDQEQLQKLIEEFLDLPVASDPDVSVGTFVVLMDSDKGPPKSHLAAGLSYLRTASHMTNHPVLGPMKEEPPTQARILRPQVTNGYINHPNALLGVGGVAANDGTKQTTYKSSTEVSGLQRFDASIEGGAKIWVRPDRASVDSHGRLQLHVVRVGPDDLAIFEGIMPEAGESYTRHYGGKNYSTTMPKLDTFIPKKGSKASTYGLGDAVADRTSSRAPSLNVPEGSQDSRQDILKYLMSPRGR